MCESCDAWVAARTRPDWPIRFRRVFGRKVSGLPAAQRVRDERGRFRAVTS